MENKEIKNNAVELNDEALENVSGGLLKPIILGGENDPIRADCAACGKHASMPKATYESRLIDGVYYCAECGANRRK